MKQDLSHRLFRILSSIALVALLVPTRSALASSSAALPSGLWDAVVVVNDVEVPFRLELRNRGGQLSGAFFNGDERVRSTRGQLVGDVLSLEFDHYAGTLEAKWSDGNLTGSYGRAGQAPYSFRARPHVQRATTAQSVPSIAGQWEIGVSSPKGEAAWRLFVRQSGAQVSASILRVDGDTGTLTGAYRDGKFVLSHFSGARPALWVVTANGDGSLTLVQNEKATYTAERASSARAKGQPEPADPARWTSVKDPSKPLHFTATDLNGALVTESDPRFRGKVVLLNVMGSWCPNCHDEASFLARLARKYRKRGLEVVALSFEDAEQLKNPTRLRAFIATYGIDYSGLLGGEPKEIATKLPDAVNLNTWPATFFIGRDGLVRGVHAGFAGKATGDAHKRLTAELTRTVETLLAETFQPR